MWVFSSKAAFLGDPRFPNHALNWYKGGRIQFFQYLYEKYSALAFTNETDRPVAIRGLERRLIHAFGTTGCYGVFAMYLGRSLLWQRRDNIPLRRIVQSPEQQKVTSWSWMAYSGCIKYMDIPFGIATWWSKNIGLVSRRQMVHGMEEQPDVLDLSLVIWANVRRLAKPGEGESKSMILDQYTNFTLDPLSLSCVVIADCAYNGVSGDTIYLILLVVPSETHPRVYERMGVGQLRKSCIDWDSFKKIILI